MENCCEIDFDKIKQFRIAREISQSEMAFEMGIWQSEVAKIENGTRKNMTFYSLCRFATYFRMPVEYFIRRKE